MPRLKDEPGSEVVQYTKASKKHNCIQNSRITKLEKTTNDNKDLASKLEKKVDALLNEIKGLREDIVNVRVKDIKELQISERVHDKKIQDMIDASIADETQHQRWDDRIVGAAITIIIGIILIVVGYILSSIH